MKRNISEPETEGAMADEPVRGAAGTMPPDAFRRALGQFPTGVTIATAFAKGRPVGMTGNSFSCVWHAPPLVLWCVAKEPPSYPSFVGPDTSAIHFLDAGHQELA